MEGPPEIHSLTDAQAGRQQFIVLRQHPDPPEQFTPVLARGPAQHPYRAAVGCAQPLDAFDGSGLARAVGAHQAEDRASLHLEADIVNRGDVAVVFGEVRNLDDKVGHGFSGCRDGRDGIGRTAPLNQRA